MEFLNTLTDAADSKFVIFALNPDFICECNFCSNRHTDSFSLMVLSDHVWGVHLNREHLMEKFQTLNPLIDCQFVDAVKMIKYVISNHVKYEIDDSKDSLFMSFRATRYDISIHWNIALVKLISNEMFHHFVKPLIGALSKSHKIGTYLSDKWKSTRLYLDYVCLNNSIKVDVNKSFLNIPSDFSDLEEIVELSQNEIGSADNFSLIRAPFERQVKKNCEQLRATQANKHLSCHNEPEKVVKNPGDKDGLRDEKQRIRLKNLADKLDKERNKQPKNKKKKLI